MGSISVPTADDVATKWASRAGVAAADYTKGVSNPKKDWMNNTVAAAATFQAAISAGNMGAKFASGVKKAGNTKWQENAKTLGSQRYTAGINQAKTAMSNGIAPMLQALSVISLPDRQPRGSSANIARVQAVADALHQKRVALQGAGV